MAENHEQDVELLDEDEVITLEDDEGNLVDFYQGAVVEYQGDFYALLQPAEPTEGIADDEALIFKVTEADEENDNFEPVLDEKILEAVFNEYLKAEAEYCDCHGECDGDCDCDDCGDDDCDCGCCGHDHCGKKE